MSQKRIKAPIRTHNTICLSMIVRDKASVIVRCLTSVLPFIDYWIICDTGSTDGTQKIITDFFKQRHKPGALHERPWKNVAHNRTEALELARPHCDYTVIINADDVLALPPGFKRPYLNADSYTFEIIHGALRYSRTQLVRSALRWRYEGVLYEFLSYLNDIDASRIFPETRNQKSLPGVQIRIEERTGDRPVVLVSHEQDAEILIKALANETDPFLISRYTFYAAQSYQGAGNKESALELYIKRSKLGFWQEEVYISLYRAANIRAELGHSKTDVIAAYEQAVQANNRRAEALHAASRYCRQHEMHQEGYDFAKRALNLFPPPGSLFLEKWVYDYGVLDEYGVNAYWIGEYEASLKAGRKLLGLGKKVPDHYLERLKSNLLAAEEQLRQKKTPVTSLQPEVTHPAENPSDGAAVISPSDAAHIVTLQYLSSRSRTLHILGVAHTVANDDYAVCAFTAKVLFFPEVIQPLGWSVIEYSNEGSASKAHQHVVILTKERLRALSKRTSRDEPMDADVNNKELGEEFQRILVEKVKARARPGDIICHVWGPNMGVYNEVKDCHQLELSVGYSASPGLPFRVYESSAWMHVHYGKVESGDGSHYKWVVPSAFDTNKWSYEANPEDYAIFLGRITPRKGMSTLVEIARRMPELTIRAYGPGDPGEWAKDAPPNLRFMGPVFGQGKIEVMQRARCKLMPTNYVEPFGFSGIEAQLCGVPLISTSFGAFQETIIEGVTGYRCHTLADWVAAIRLSWSLDRRMIAELARTKYSKEAVGKQYNWIFQQLADLSERGWYGDVSRKFGEVRTSDVRPQQARIWLYIPYFGQLPNFFQLYLDSLGRNSDILSVIFLTDIDLGEFILPKNMIVVPITLDEIRHRAARLMRDAFEISINSEDLIKKPHKLCDFKIAYPEMFDDIGHQFGIKETDYVGWGDCDLIYGQLSEFLIDNDYGVIGGLHGHFTAFRNSDSFRKLFREVEDLPKLLTGDWIFATDEIGFRKPLLGLLDRQNLDMFYADRHFCDVVPELFIGEFRKDHALRQKNFFDVYNLDRDIDYIRYDVEGRLTVFYEDGSSRSAIYCHLQKRQMALDIDLATGGYDIRENTFTKSACAAERNRKAA